MDFQGYYDGRVVEAEREAIRLRKDDVNRACFWLWEPFGPSEERERELTTPKPQTYLHSLAGLGVLQSAYAQSGQMALMQAVSSYGGYNQYAQRSSGLTDALGLPNMGAFVR